jgi:hypothetical protein
LRSFADGGQSASSLTVRQMARRTPWRIRESSPLSAIAAMITETTSSSPRYSAVV